MDERQLPGEARLNVNGQEEGIKPAWRVERLGTRFDAVVAT